MDWKHATTAEIDGCIARLREDQRAQVQLSEEAASVERRAHAVQVDCRQRLADDAVEIDHLLDERTRP